MLPYAGTRLQGRGGPGPWPQRRGPPSPGQARRSEVCAKAARQRGMASRSDRGDGSRRGDGWVTAVPRRRPENEFCGCDRAGQRSSWDASEPQPPAAAGAARATAGNSMGDGHSPVTRTATRVPAEGIANGGRASRRDHLVPSVDARRVLVVTVPGRGGRLLDSLQFLLDSGCGQRYVSVLDHDLLADLGEHHLDELPLQWGQGLVGSLVDIDVEES